MQALIADALPVLSGVLGVAPRTHGRSRSAISIGDVSVATTDSIAGLEALETEWLALERAEGSTTTPFQTYRFHREWVRHFVDADVSFRVVTVRSNGNLVLVLPLAVRRTALGNVATWMGDPLIQYGDAICSPNGDTMRWMDAAYASLKRDGSISVLSLTRVRADSAVAAWCDARMFAIGAPEQAISIDLSGFSEEGDFARARASRAARNRKRRRKLEKIGEVALRVVKSGDEAVRLVEQAVEMKKVWLQERGLMGRAFSDDRMQACLEALVRSPGDSETSDGAVICSLEIDGRPASIEYAFRHNGRHCAFMGAFESEWSRHSPGQVQMQDTIERCIADGATAYDLMAPADPYKCELGTTAVDVQDYSTVLSYAGLPAALWTSYGARSAKAVFSLMPQALRMSIRARLA
ncbi:GNAT family N-acetyltransferase [Microbaculum marinum]|uniref:GNAT family N-acetyltransferase n=1 Tax=Microbaculum marinum TaxID=1764581 RepID=A0AAW9RKY8_9HYPH